MLHITYDHINLYITHDNIYQYITFGHINQYIAHDHNCYLYAVGEKHENKDIKTAIKYLYMDFFPNLLFNIRGKRFNFNSCRLEGSWKEANIKWQCLKESCWEITKLYGEVILLKCLAHSPEQIGQKTMWDK